jgi:hypothetical protein
MIASRPMVRWGVLAAALLQLIAAPAWGQSKKAATKKTTTPPIVQPTASQGSTATAIRGRPANVAAAKSVAAALKTALTKPAVQNAVRTELLRQLRANRPIALLSGSWVSVINMGLVYAIPAVRVELVSSLGVNGPQLLGAASTLPGGLTLAFTRISLGRILMPSVRGIENTLGVDALSSHMTEGLLGDIAGAVFAGVDVVMAPADFVVGLAVDAVGAVTQAGIEVGTATANNGGSYDPNADPDGDGIANWKDDDDDGDGVSDQQDNYPADPKQSICDCGRGRGMAFGTSVAANLLPTLVSGATMAARATRVSLGPAVPGQAGTLTMSF